MSALKDKTPRFMAGWNAASAGRELNESASEESWDGYDEYHLAFFPPVPPLRTSHGCDSEKAKAQRKILTRQTFLITKSINDIKHT